MIDLILKYNLKPKKKILSKIVVQSINFMIDNISEEINLADIAKHLGVSKFSICRHFSREYGMGPMKFLWTLRAILAYEAIKACPYISIIDISAAFGFSSTAHFSRFFKKFYNKTPSEFKLECLKQYCASQSDKNNNKLNVKYINMLLALSSSNYINWLEKISL